MLLYTYISRFSVTPTISNPAELPPPTLFPNRSSLRFQLPSQTPHACFHRQSGYTLGFPRKIAHSGLHAETGAFRTGPLSLPSERSARSQTSPGRVYARRTQKACGTAMRLCVSLSRRRRGPAGLRDLFRFCRNRDLYIRRSWFSACARHGWYHYPRCAPRAAETLGGRLSKRLICRFSRSGGLH